MERNGRGAEQIGGYPEQKGRQLERKAYLLAHAWNRPLAALEPIARRAIAAASANPLVAAASAPAIFGRSLPVGAGHRSLARRSPPAGAGLRAPRGIGECPARRERHGGA